MLFHIPGAFSILRSTAAVYGGGVSGSIRFLSPLSRHEAEAELPTNRHNPTLHPASSASGRSEPTRGRPPSERRSCRSMLKLPLRLGVLLHGGKQPLREP